MSATCAHRTDRRLQRLTPKPLSSLTSDTSMEPVNESLNDEDGLCVYRVRGDGLAGG